VNGDKGGTAMGVTSEELALLDEDGYLVKRGLIPAEWLRTIQQECDGLHEQMAEHTPDGVHISWEEFDDPGRSPRIRQLMHAELVSEGLKRLVYSDEVLDVLEAVMGPDISLFHCKLLMKAARDGTITPWHQDYGYWVRTENRPLMMNCMLAIDDADEENGCIQFVPRSHKQGLQHHDRRNTSFGLFLPGYFQKREDALPCAMRAGDAVFFGPLVVHGSDANRSDRHRRAVTIAYDVTGNGYCRAVVRGRPSNVKNF
jgi:ectoine hydroxylase-related dioxygenase (phytanoyl-CoA dioxygenase family)